jgi:hypothetical protein
MPGLHRNGASVYEYNLRFLRNDNDEISEY